ncbi:hypothetical protein ACJ41O_008482 [Fusarium nematophilum]
MTEKQKNLSHEEMWDDSALIDSWNEALEEYKKYHSIHARGGSIRDLESKSQTTTKGEPSTEAQDAEITQSGIDSASNQGVHAVNDEVPPSARDESRGDVTSQGLPSFPIQAVLGSVQDESLKKLLMSWYYAGYYTGLFEGQQQAQQNRGS